MIISRYFTKEIFNTLLAVTFVILLIFLSNKLVRYLSYASVGKVAPNILMQLMGFEIPYLLALLLPLGLYLAIILAYGRLYADSELRVLHACGLGIKRLIGMTSFLIITVTSLVVLLTLWVNPWIAEQKSKLIAYSLSTDNLLNNLMPGRFQVSPDGRHVFYVERISRNHKQADNIFIADQGKKQDENTHWTVISAASGTQIKDPISQDRFIVAREGYRYDGIPGNNDYKIIQFKQYAVRLPTADLVSKRDEQEAIPTQTLWRDYAKPENASELQWRLSIPLSALLLGLLAIPLSKIQPRHGRYSQLIPGILIYIVYMNILFVARNWVELKWLPAGLGLWWVHLILFLIALTLILIQSGWDIRNINRRSV